ncbi:MAG: 1-deoxy-D-xylulose-5-phosphate synthase [Acutalibacteraceae bacterium]|nr:1-deoxy-D-xylulose-5-phosphate synthase [Oscillospiraceae bacterium]
MEINYLDKIRSPQDLKSLSGDKLNTLAEEIRSVLIETVSQNGGHLASNLGVVELTIAIHKVFDSPKDQIVFDVGHQAYTHKLLTGRYEKFSTVRTSGGLTGFTNPDESEHDIFFSGHSTTSISASLGLAQAKLLNGDDNYVVAVIGDGSFTGGMAYEALNNAGKTKSKLIVILNDNKMSISENVGAFASYLAVIRTDPRYFRLKQRTEKALNRIPVIGTRISTRLFNLKTALKNKIYNRSTFFEDIGFRYMGPIDGHNIKQLCQALEGAKIINGPVVLHVITTKGKGYDFAEKMPSEFHGIAKFDIETGEPLSAEKSFSSFFGEALCRIAENDDRICAVTAAMSLGTGLNGFADEFPERFFDVGIAEQHAVTFTSGLAKNGKIPVFAVYSTFLQRAYDQLIHDISLQRSHCIFAVDRAGFVGEDGVTHQGIFDVSFLNAVPNFRIYAPSSFSELENDLKDAVYENDGPVVIRYPRGNEAYIEDMPALKSEFYNIYGDIENAEKVIVTYGRISKNAVEAMKKSENTAVVKLNIIKPISSEAVEAIAGKKKIYFFEEGVRSGGVGENLALSLMENGCKGKFKLIAVDGEFVEQATVEEQLEKYGLDTESMIRIINEVE